MTLNFIPLFRVPIVNLFIVKNRGQSNFPSLHSIISAFYNSLKAHFLAFRYILEQLLLLRDAALVYLQFFGRLDSQNGFENLIVLEIYFLSISFYLVHV